MNSLLTAACIAVVLWIIWQKLEKEVRCRYCGGFTHETNCPYNLDREER